METGHPDPGSLINASFKGSVSRDFRPSFFFIIRKPSRPLKNRLKYFEIWFRFHRDIQIFKKLRGVHHTMMSSSTVCIIPRSQTLLCASYREVKLPGVHPTHEVKLRSVMHTAESGDQKFFKTLRCASHCGSDSAVCIPPRSWAPRCASYHGVKLRSVHHTAGVKLHTAESKLKSLWISGCF